TDLCSARADRLRLGRDRLTPYDHGDAGEDEHGADADRPGQLFVQDDRTERDRDDRVHVRVRRDLPDRRVVQEPDVGGVADDRAEADEIEPTAYRARGE